MKFQFCGNGDCPDWVLGEIISTLSIMSSDDLKLLVEIVVKKICGENFDELLIQSLLGPSITDGKSAIACIHFLLINSVSYGASLAVFKEEIQQLGFPNEHAEIMCQVLNKYYSNIKNQLKKDEFKVNELVAVRVLPYSPNSTSCKTLEFKIASPLMQSTVQALNIDKVQLKVLLDELQLAHGVMKKYKLNEGDINEGSKMEEEQNRET